jgi:hypothetical protein
VGHFKVTVLRIIRAQSGLNGEIGEKREGEYACYTEASGTPFCRVPGVVTVIATLDGWRL